MVKFPTQLEMQLVPAGNFAENQLCWSQLGPTAANPSWDQLLLVPAGTNCSWSQPGPTAVGRSWKCGQKPVQLVLAIVGSSPATVSDSCMIRTQCMERLLYFKVYSLCLELLQRSFFGTPCVLALLPEQVAYVGNYRSCCCRLFVLVSPEGNCS